MPEEHLTKLKKIVSEDKYLFSYLKLVRDILPIEAWIGGGAVRNTVWNAIYEKSHTEFSDIDVLYYQKGNTISPEREYENILNTSAGLDHWSVKNQYQISLKYGHGEVVSVEHAMQFWVETATAVAVRLDEEGRIHVLHPFGLEDLFKGIIRPTSPEKAAVMMQRIKAKNWLGKWPELQMEL